MTNTLPLRRRRSRARIVRDYAIYYTICASALIGGLIVGTIAAYAVNAVIAMVA